MNLFTGVGILLVLLGFLFIGVTIILFVRKYLRQKNWTKTMGVVVNVQASQGMRRGNTGSTRNTVYKPTVRFQAADGRLVDYTPAISTTWSNYAVGENVQIQYDPQQPQKASIGAGSISYMPFFITGFFGIMAVFVGAFFVLMNRK